MRDLAARLKPILDRRARDERDLVPKAVQGRNTDGTLRLRPQEGECVLRGAVGPNYTGQVISEAPSPTFNRRGLSGTTIASTGAGSTLWIERLEPSELPRGQTLTVLVIGRGITASTRIEFADGVLTDASNPDVRILKQTYIDSTRLELEVARRTRASSRTRGFFTTCEHRFCVTDSPSSFKVRAGSGWRNHRARSGGDLLLPRCHSAAISHQQGKVPSTARSVISTAPREGGST